MISISVRLDPPKRGSELDKQVRFALTMALTATAKDAQGEIRDSLQDTFTIRNRWLDQSNKFGIKVRPAKKDDLVAQVGTDADWLQFHEEGGIKTPQGHFIAIPTRNVRRTKKQIIQKGQRPRALIGKRDFLITTKAGRVVLFQRTGRGKRSGIKAMYVMVPRSSIKKHSTILDPTMKAIQQRFGGNFSKALKRAIATARP
jgi:hypothetical protein